MFRGMSTCMVTSNASEKISTAIEFTGGIGPDEWREREGHEVLRCF